MADEVSSQSDPTAVNQKKKRQRSTIGFPYSDLETSVLLARAIHSNVGHGECDDDQLAAWTKQSSKSSTFRVQVYAARIFGIIEGEGTHHTLTPLGRRVVDLSTNKEAKIEAFLNVPLFREVYEKYKGGVIPPTSTALEHELAQLGVAAKQASRARVSLERSADSAGFFENGRDRLVKPGLRNASALEEAPGDQSDTSMDQNNSRQSPGAVAQSQPIGNDLHPFIQGLLQSLPEPDSEWETADRVKWLQTAANIFDLIYKGGNGIIVEAAIADRSPRPSS